VSAEPGRAAFLVDGDPDTRWFGRQDGTSAIALRFAAPHDIARVELQLATRSWNDHPRELAIDATDRGGRTRTRYRASPFAEFASALVRTHLYPPLTIDLPPNDAAVLTIRETATHSSWWSVHELRVWKR